jgi:hypothetical protein
MRRLEYRAVLALSLLILCTHRAGAADAPTDTPTLPAPGGCDVVWERIKSVLPMPKARYEQWLKAPVPQTLWGPSSSVDQLDDADMHYYMARVPFVVGIEGAPSLEQRDEWLQKAAGAGHKAAKAALMRLRYLGPIDMEWLISGQGPKPLVDPRATRVQYLQAAREAAEAGDPEFASVMMDTARNIKGYLHCQNADKDNKSDHSCKPQEVTQPIETRKWAEIAGMGGNPNSMKLMCDGYSYGTPAKWGFEQNDDKAFPWCFALETTVCRGSHRLLEGMYEIGKGTPRDAEAARALREKYPRPIRTHKQFNFPLTSR